MEIEYGHKNVNREINARLNDHMVHYVTNKNAKSLTM